MKLRDYEEGDRGTLTQADKRRVWKEHALRATTGASICRDKRLKYERHHERALIETGNNLAECHLGFPESDAFTY